MRCNEKFQRHFIQLRCVFVFIIESTDRPTTREHFRFHPVCCRRRFCVQFEYINLFLTLGGGSGGGVRHCNLFHSSRRRKLDETSDPSCFSFSRIFSFGINEPVEGNRLMKSHIKCSRFDKPPTTPAAPSMWWWKNFYSQALTPAENHLRRSFWTSQ